jgi:type IV pilus assembly protein PilM
MALFGALTGLLTDPPPTCVFELSEAGVAVAEIDRNPRITFGGLSKDVIFATPLRDNVLRPDALLAQIRALAPGDSSRKRRRAALVLPDFAVRVTVLDFDDFPSDPKEQASLVRFRLKRTIPFDVDSAALSFYAQGERSKTRKKLDVVAAVAPLEVVAHYEAPFRLAGFHLGHITTSALAALDLVPATGVQILTKKTGRVLTLAVLAQGVLRLVRTIELTDFNAEEIAGHLFPTLAYVEDQIEASPDTLLFCGFGPTSGEALSWFQTELGVRTGALSSRWGQPGEFNAGLLGYLEAVKES